LEVDKIIEEYAVKNNLSIIYIYETVAQNWAYIDKKKNITKNITEKVKGIKNKF
jgi:hypothetical protein